MSRAENAAQLAPYRALVRIAELELELAAAGRYSEMTQLQQQRSQVLGRLPRPAPAGALEQLERAAAIQRRIKVELLRRREIVLLSLRRIELSKRAASGYARSMMAGRRRERVAAKA